MANLIPIGYYKGYQPSPVKKFCSIRERDRRGPPAAKLLEFQVIQSPLVPRRTHHICEQHTCVFTATLTHRADIYSPIHPVYGGYTPSLGRGSPPRWVIHPLHGLSPPLYGLCTYRHHPSLYLHSVLRLVPTPQYQRKVYCLHSHTLQPHPS